MEEFETNELEYECSDPNFLANKYMFFDTDNDFYSFAVVPAIVMKEVTGKDKTKRRFFDFNLTNMYNDAVSNGQMFVIRDPKSLIAKRNAVTMSCITKPVQNIKPYNRVSRLIEEKQKNNKKE